jgi:hypothetical protein
MSSLTIKAQSLMFESKTPWSTARGPKKPRKAQEGHLEDGKPQKPRKGKKAAKPRKWQRRAKKTSEEQEKLKPRQKLKISTPPNTLDASTPP